MHEIGKTIRKFSEGGSGGWGSHVAGNDKQLPTHPDSSKILDSLLFNCNLKAFLALHPKTVQVH